MLRLARQSDALADLAARRIEHDQFAGFPRCHGDFSVGREGNGLRSHSRQVKLATPWSQHLIDGRDNQVLAPAPHQQRFAILLS